MATRAKKADGPAALLLVWYDKHRRMLPWRAPKGQVQDPYKVWLSEIMLQQTTVQAVGPYFAKFLKKWPTVKALARAEQDDVLAAWAGLGYYARARNLHKAAKAVAERGGKFPATYDGLRELPGIGDYTAGAIAAIAYDLPYPAMDANAERVIARYAAIEEPLPKSKPAIRAALVALVPQKRAGDFAQALMDLGSAICTPKRPACLNCPWMDGCEARKLGIQEQLPARGAKAARPLKRGAAFVARDASGAVLLMKRPEKGLLGGMLQPPLGPWTEDFPSKAEALKQAPFKAEWKKRAGVVRHGFTHFELEIEVYVADVISHPPLEGGSIKFEQRSEASAQNFSGRGRSTDPSPKFAKGKFRPSLKGRVGGVPESLSGMTEMFWVEEKNLKDAALPTVMRKIVAHAIGYSRS